MAKVVHLTSVHTINDPRIVLKECTSLANAGYEVTLIVPHEGTSLVNGVKIHSLSFPKNRWQRIIQTIPHLYRAALQENAAIYHFHDPELIPIGLLLRMHGKQVIYDVHEDYVTSIEQKRYLPRLLRLPLAGFWAKVETLVTRPFQIVLAEKYYTHRFPNGITVLNYPTRTHFAISNEGRYQPRLLYTGVVSEDRGALLHAQIVTLIDNVEVYIVGRCSKGLADRMRQMAGNEKDRLHIEGEGFHVPYSRILDYYAQGKWTSGLAIFPPTTHYIRKELTKFFEYMRAGMPIVCSDFPVWRSLIEETGAGLCVDPLDPKAIADAIQYLVDHPEEAKKMGQNGRRAFETRYNWDSEAKKLIGLYNDLIE